MFCIFKKKSSVDNLEWLGVYMHSHFLPGIDDGLANVTRSISLIQKLNAIGVTKIHFTPHIFKELYPNSSDTINFALKSVKQALSEAKMSVGVGAETEYMIDENYVLNKDLMCLPNRHLLIEMSYLSETANIEKTIFDHQMKGYTVILAHPERYVFYHQDPSRFSRFKDMGVLFELNLLSVAGYYGKEVKKMADHLLIGKMYDLAGTDLHHDKHLDALTRATQSGFLYEKLGSHHFKNEELFQVSN